MEPNLTPNQAMALIVTIPLIIFIVVDATDKVRAPEIRWGQIKSALYFAVICAGASLSGVLAYNMAKLPGAVTPLLAYSITASVLSTFLYTCKIVTVTLGFRIASKKAKLKSSP